MSKALLMILPLPEGMLFDSTAIYELDSQLGREKLSKRASFLGFVDGESPSDIYVLKNRVGFGGSQPLAVLEQHITERYRKQPEEEKTYGTYY